MDCYSGDLGISKLQRVHWSVEEPSATDRWLPEGLVRLHQDHWRSGWITGFVDGEGCFSVGFIRQGDRLGRRGYIMGYQVAHEFAVTQGASSVSSLELIRDFFGCGDIYINKRYDNHKEHLNRYVVRRRDLLSDVIIPFFERNTLQTSKLQNFQKFCQVIQLMKAGAHLTKEGLTEIVHIAETMNHKRPRPEILRDIAARAGR